MAAKRAHQERCRHADKRPVPLILFNCERHYTLPELSRLLPDQPGYDSLRRWCVAGVQDEFGDDVRMESIFGPRRRCRRSSVEAYQRFIDRINGYERS